MLDRVRALKSVSCALHPWYRRTWRHSSDHHARNAPSWRPIMGPHSPPMVSSCGVTTVGREREREKAFNSGSGHLALCTLCVSATHSCTQWLREAVGGILCPWFSSEPEASLIDATRLRDTVCLRLAGPEGGNGCQLTSRTAATRCCHACMTTRRHGTEVLTAATQRTAPWRCLHPAGRRSA